MRLFQQPVNRTFLDAAYMCTRCTFPGTRRQPLLDKICCWPIRTVRAKVPGVAVARPSVHRCHRAFLKRKSDYLYYFGVKNDQGDLQKIGAPTEERDVAWIVDWQGSSF